MKRSTKILNEDVRNIEFIGTCIYPEVAKIAEKKGVRFSYARIKKLIKKFYPKIYDDLALDFYNLWNAQTKKVYHEGTYYLIITHSMIEYVFEIIP